MIGNVASVDDKFDFAITFSSVEHTGLGRYGDALNPFGDYEAIAQIWCMLKPGGLLILGVPLSYSQDGWIVYNAHRVYGWKRLSELTANFRYIGPVPIQKANPGVQLFDQPPLVFERVD
jgi:hypothetical protein